MAKENLTAREYVDANGLTLQEFSDIVGVPLANVQRMTKRPMPNTWADKLGPGAKRQADDVPHAPGEPPPVRPERDEPVTPNPPPGARLAPVPVDVGVAAAGRIADAYRFIGGGVATATGEQAIAQVVDGYAPDIGKAWVAAAQENEFARRVVNLMSAGGPMGDLVMAHVILIGGVLYVTGRAPALAAVYRHRFGDPPPPPPVEPDGGVVVEPDRPFGSNDGTGTSAADSDVGPAAAAAG